MSDGGRFSNARQCHRCLKRTEVVGMVHLEGPMDGSYDEEGWYLCADCYDSVRAFLTDVETTEVGRCEHCGATEEICIKSRERGAFNNHDFVPTPERG